MNDYSIPSQSHPRSPWRLPWVTQHDLTAAGVSLLIGVQVVAGMHEPPREPQAIPVEPAAGILPTLSGATAVVHPQVHPAVRDYTNRTPVTLPKW